MVQRDRILGRLSPKRRLAISRSEQAADHINVAGLMPMLVRADELAADLRTFGIKVPRQLSDLQTIGVRPEEFLPGTPRRLRRALQEIARRLS